MSPSDYDSLFRSLKKLPGEIKALIEKRIELFTLEMGERVSNVIAHAIYRLTGIAFLALGLILVLFAASNFVGELLDSEGLGFIIVAAPILLAGLLFFFRRPRSMVRKTRDKLLYQFMKDISEQIGRIDPQDDSSAGADKKSNRDERNSQGPESEPEPEPEKEPGKSTK